MEDSCARTCGCTCCDWAWGGTGRAEAGVDVEGVVGVTSLLSGGERDARGAEESPEEVVGDLTKVGEWCEGGGVLSSSS